MTDKGELRMKKLATLSLVLLCACIGACGTLRPLRPEIAAAAAQWNAPEFTSDPDAKISRTGRIKFALMECNGFRVSWLDYTRGVALLARYWVTGSERVYWQAVNLMTMTTNRKESK